MFGSLRGKARELHGSRFTSDVRFEMVGCRTLWCARVRVFVMRNSLRRYYGRGDLHFVTFSCYRRSPLLGAGRARDHFVRTLDQVRVHFGFRLVTL